eukprot:GILI01006002.1.p1 GENE.GILI01006002.1~~GILI01006002.1.p1  ORF type:complete len:440 (+),score=79.98 GILI01006002.1:149-1321(+)
MYIGYYQLFTKRAYFTYPPPVFRSTRHQKASVFPPPFPNGWFMICKSEDLANGEVKEIVAFGRAYALYRTFPADTDSQRRTTHVANKHLGLAHMVEAYCPHLGANLGVAGEVSPSTNCLKCKFHGWEFDGDGKVVRVAGTDVVPNANIKKVYHVCETNGMIHLWHDSEDGAPKWDLVHREEINSTNYYLAAESLAFVNCHIQEIPENGADVAHLNVLHKDLVGDWAPNFLAFHGWSATWAVDQLKPHITNMKVFEDIKAWNSYTVPFASVQVEIHQIGPGLVTLDFHTPIGTLILHQCVLPEKVTSQRVRHVLHASSTVPRPIAKLILWAVHEQFNRDVPIWCTKRFEPKPTVSKADGPLMAFRRWYQQFYEASSVSFADALAQETMIDW